MTLTRFNNAPSRVIKLHWRVTNCQTEVVWIGKGFYWSTLHKDWHRCPVIDILTTKNHYYDYFLGFRILLFERKECNCICFSHTIPWLSKNRIVGNTINLYLWKRKYTLYIAIEIVNSFCPLISRICCLHFIQPIKWQNWFTIAISMNAYVFLTQ